GFPLLDGFASSQEQEGAGQGQRGTRETDRHGRVSLQKRFQEYYAAGWAPRHGDCRERNDARDALTRETSMTLRNLAGGALATGSLCLAVAAAAQQTQPGAGTPSEQGSPAPATPSPSTPMPAAPAAPGM